MPNYWYTHVHLISTDPLKTAEFYEKVFNAKRVSVMELDAGRVNVELDLNGSTIMIMSKRAQPLLPSTPEPGCGIEHFAIGTDDFETAVNDLKAKGAEVVRDPNAMQAFALGPENVLIELFQMRS